MLRAVRTTPGLLVAAALAVVVLGLLAGAAGWLGLESRAAALDESRAEAAHQVRLQTARTRFVVADTAAGRDVLLGGGTGRDYDLNLQPALLNLVYAAREEADTAPLAVADRYASRYAMLVEQARTEAQRGDARAASTTVRNASALLHAQVLPRLEVVQRHGGERLDGDGRSAARGPAIAAVLLVPALLVLGGVHWWLTLRTRRLLNPGLAAAVVILLTAGVAAALVVAGSLSAASDVRSGPQREADHLVEARFAAFEARSGEALAVLAGTVPAEETAWQGAMDRADTALRQAGQSPELLANYREVHGRLLAAARRGDTAAVQAAAVSPDPERGAVGAFDDFDVSTGALLARQVQRADDGWAASTGGLRLTGRLCLIAGLVAAGLGWSGLEQRRREYR